MSFFLNRIPFIRMLQLALLEIPPNKRMLDLEHFNVI